MIAEIERRRSFVRQSKDVTLCGALERIESAVRSSVRRDSSLQSAWRSVAPPEVLARARATSFRAGTLTIIAKDQSGKYLVDRWMQAKGRLALGAILNAAVLKVSIRMDGGVADRGTGDSGRKAGPDRRGRTLGS